METKYFKILDGEGKDGITSYTHHIGLNEMYSIRPEEFRFTKLEYIEKFTHGLYLAELEVPHDARLIQSPNGKEYTSNKIIINTIHSLMDINTYTTFDLKISDFYFLLSYCDSSNPFVDDSSNIFINFTLLPIVMGNLELFKYASKIGIDRYMGRNRQHVLKTNNFRVGYDLMVTNIMEMLKFNNYYKYLLITLAAYFGHLDIFEHLHASKYEIPDNICTIAAAGNNLDIIKYVRNFDYPWDENTCKVAAEKGHLEIVKYLHNNKCPWNEETCGAAAENDHIDILKYAYSNGCPWPLYSRIYYASKIFSDSKCVEYARQTFSSGYLMVVL